MPSTLGNIEGLETQLLSVTPHEPTAPAFQAVAWDEVGWKFWVPAWEAYTGKYANVLAGNTPRTLPELAQHLEAFAHRLSASDGKDLAPEDRLEQAAATLGMALTVALSRNGWELHVIPGEDTICERKGTVIKPFDIVPELVSGELSPETWHELCVNSGIADLDLSGRPVIDPEDPPNERVERTEER